MAETDPSQLECSICGNEGLYMDDDGHFYCTNCNSQADGMFDKANADEDFLDKGNFGAAIYSAAHKRSVHLPPSFAADSQFNDDHIGPIEPADFGVTPKGIDFKDEDYYNTIRMRYVLGVQLLIQFQCEALVDKFGVTPLVCGISASIWMRFIALTRVFADDWADKTVLDSEIGEKRCQLGKHVPNEPRNMHNERMVIIWFKSLKKRIPLSHSLAISYLACHVAKEPILPTDIIKWAIEGRLPYFGAFNKIAESIKKIEKSGHYVSVVCPLKASSMFRPSDLPLQKLESQAASIAHAVGLSLPPVNFYRIAYRYLKKLSLPVEKIIPYACRIQEWSMPPDLWLSAKEGKLPARVCVMSILIVAIRILYNLNGFGKWEKTHTTPIESSSMDDQKAGFDKSNAKKDSTGEHKILSGESGGSSPSVHIYESESAELLYNLEKRFDELNDIFEYSKDLPTYLQYCKDVVFAGIEPLYKDPTLIEELWDFYEKNRECSEFDTGSKQKRSRDNDNLFSTPSKDSKNHKDEKIMSSASDDSKYQFHNNSSKLKREPGVDNTQQSSQTCQVPVIADEGKSSSQNYEDEALKYLKINMEEQRFSYIPPRVDIKRHDHLHYGRKKGNGCWTYIAHADYYILLRACAKVAQVDVRIMHVSVLNLERRLACIEKRINHRMMEKCSSGTPADHDINFDDEFVNLSNLSL